jgi:VanZ family protein
VSRPLVTRRPVHHTRQRAAATIIATAIAVIALVTLTPAVFSYKAQTLRIAFDLSPTHLREDALNALLFVPLGFGSALAGRRLTHSVLLALAVSLAVELLQWTVVPGRFAEIQDVAANVAGALIGHQLWIWVAAGGDR